MEAIVVPATCWESVASYLVSDNKSNRSWIAFKGKKQSHKNQRSTGKGTPWNRSTDSNWWSKIGMWQKVNNLWCKFSGNKKCIDCSTDCIKEVLKWSWNTLQGTNRKIIDSKLPNWLHRVGRHKSVSVCVNRFWKSDEIWKKYTSVCVFSTLLNQNHVNTILYMVIFTHLKMADTEENHPHFRIPPKKSP